MVEYSFGFKALILTAFFICGGAGAVLGNIIYNIKSLGLHNTVKPFEKPIFQTWVMFLAMTFLIFDTPYFKTGVCQGYTTGGVIRGIGLFRVVSIPSLCDLISTYLQNIGLLYLPPSVLQITRGSILLFTAILTVFYRKRKLRFHEWIGVIITIIGIAIVGVSSVLSNKDHSSTSRKSSAAIQLIAILLIFLAQALQALQTVIEEKLLHDIESTENELVSYEGIWGFYFTTFIAMPVAQILPESMSDSLFEHTGESFVMISHSLLLFFCVICYMITVVVYNVSGMYVTSFSSAIHRNIYESLRTSVVWIFAVIIHYAFPNSGSGESLNIYSLVELLGFLISILGSFIYNEVIKINCFGSQKANTDPLLPEK